jgi:ribonuclease BN (tRNA processing enzyme)
MELVVLGSGTAIPHANRNPTGFVVRSGGRAVLVDTGPGTIHRLPRVGVAFQEVEDAFYTHLHVDHMLDLVSLLFAKRNADVPNAPTLTLYGGAGFADMVQKLRDLFHPWLEPRGYNLKVKEYASALTLGGLGVRACRVRHHPSSLAYRFEDGQGRSLVISGDTEEDEALIELAGGASLLVLECSFPEGNETGGHLTPSAAGRMARRAGAHRLLLTHFYPQCDGREILGPSRKAFGGEVLLAHDWMHVRVD